MSLSEIMVTRVGQQVRIRPPVPALQETILGEHHVAVEDPIHGLRIERQTLPLVTPGEWLEKPIQVAHAGLEPRIVESLCELGYTVRLSGYCPGPLPPPHRPESGGDAPDDAVLEFIQNHDRGIVRCDLTHVKVARLVTQIVEAFPKKKILVLVSRRNDVRYLDRLLRKRGINVARVLAGWSPFGQYRVVVCTYLGVALGVATAEHRDIVLYVNPTEVFCLAGCEGLKDLWRARIFGILPIECQLASPVKEQVAAIFGDQSVSVPKHGRVARRVCVVFVPSQVTGKPRRDETEWEVRLRLLIHHPVRNRRIAHLAKAFADEDYTKLGASPPGFTSLATSHLGGRVGILASTVDHALALSRHLPGWPVLTEEQVWVEGVSHSDKARLSSVDSDSQSCSADAIVTTSALPRAGWFDILICADAGVGLPAIRGINLLGNHDTDDSLLLVDFDDRHHPLARTWTRSRKAAYEATGWSILGGPQMGTGDRLHTPTRVAQPFLPYQTSKDRPFIQGGHRTAEHQYKKRRERRKKEFLRKAGGQITLSQVADRDHLVDCFRELVREGGPAAGIDGISPRAVSLSDFGKIAQEFSKALKEKRWQPQKPRLVPIPKPGTSETRDLKIGTLLDRVVGKALHETLQPYWEKIYLPGSFGFREARNVWQMIAELEATMEKNDCWVLAIDDVRKAFDNVPVTEALTAHQTIIMSKSKGKQPALAEDVLELIETVLRGHDLHEVGIDQGGCYSPDTLNIFLHAVHDAPLSAGDNAPLWFRYADNLVYPVQNVSEGRRVLARVRRLLRKVGLSLKGKDGIADLNAGDNALLLGFRLWREDGRLRIGLGENALDQLREHLADAWKTPDPNTTAEAILRLWIDANGPAFENGVTVIADVLRLASRLGFRELPGPAELRECWERAWQRWRVCRMKARRRVLRRKRR
jgi:RNA-directed DNA polymerase